METTPAQKRRQALIVTLVGIAVCIPGFILLFTGDSTSRVLGWVIIGASILFDVWSSLLRRAAKRQEETEASRAAGPGIG